MRYDNGLRAGRPGWRRGFPRRWRRFPRRGQLQSPVLLGQRKHPLFVAQPFLLATDHAVLFAAVDAILRPTEYAERVAEAVRRFCRTALNADLQTGEQRVGHQPRDHHDAGRQHDRVGQPSW